VLLLLLLLLVPFLWVLLVLEATSGTELSPALLLMSFPADLALWDPLG
jgi:hypothetical protein